MFFLRYTHDGLSCLDFVSFALGPSHLDSGARNLVPELLLAVWFGATILLTADRVITGNGAGWAGQFFAALLLSVGACGAYALWNAARLATIGPLPRGLGEGLSLVSQAQGYEFMTLVWMGITLGLILAGGIACFKLASERHPQAVSRPQKSSRAGLVVAVVVFAGSLVLAWRVDFRSASADACSRWAEVMQSQKVWPAANDVFERAIQICPGEFIYRSRFALALREQAEAVRDDAASSRLMQQARQVLEQSKSLAGYNRRDWHLAQLYMAWAMRETNQIRLTELALHAKDTFNQALLWEPRNPPLWSDCAFVDLFLLHKEEDGLRENQKALEIDPTCEQALGRLGDFYAQESKHASDAVAKRQYASEAVKYYRLATYNTGAPFAFLMAAGRLTLGLGDLKQAVDDFSRASKAAPADEVWKSEEMLARSYLALTNKVTALEHLERAIAGAGPEQKPALLELEKQVERSRR
jgi:tetratricopeptide (TPR) repeat protein